MAVITGAPGVGKSSVVAELAGGLTRGLALDGDFTGRPEYASDMALLRSWLGDWLRRGARESEDGGFLVLAVFVRPRELEELPEHALLDDIVYVALVCGEDELADRLRNRPKSLGVTDDEIASLVALNSEVRRIAEADERVSLVDTTGRTVSDVVREVEAVLSERLGGYA
jgi:broad-specificity NMP kinase